MIDVPRSWRFERDGELLFAGVAGDLAWFGQSRLRADGWLSGHPSWQMVFGADSDVTVCDADGKVTRAAGLIVPPGRPRWMFTGLNAVHLWIDPASVIAGRRAGGVIPLDPHTVDALLCAVDGGKTGVAERLLPHLADIFGPRPEFDPRLRIALDHLGTAQSVAELASTAGVTPRRLRQLAAPVIGGSLRDLRRWHRLRQAGLDYPFMSATDAAVTAGFADQSHLIRTSKALTSRTLASVAEPVLRRGSSTDVHGLHRQ